MCNFTKFPANSRCFQHITDYTYYRTLLLYNYDRNLDPYFLKLS
jgi:hypothetical protein